MNTIELQSSDVIDLCSSLGYNLVGRIDTWIHTENSPDFHKNDCQDILKVENDEGYYALKLVTKSKDDGSHERFMRNEIYWLKKINSELVFKLISDFDTDKYIGFIMPIYHKTLKRAYDDHDISLDFIKTNMLSIIDVLVNSHCNHRDLTVYNVYYDKGRLVIGDFAAACELMDVNYDLGFKVMIEQCCGMCHNSNINDLFNQLGV